MHLGLDQVCYEIEYNKNKQDCFALIYTTL